MRVSYETAFSLRLVPHFKSSRLNGGAWAGLPEGSAKQTLYPQKYRLFVLRACWQKSRGSLAVYRTLGKTTPRQS